MILVTIGSQKFQFDRLLKKVDELMETGEIQEKVVAQSGNSNYVPKHFEAIRFIATEDMDKLVDECSLMITHGGTAGIMRALAKHKKVVAVPRLAQYGEHVDNHQKQIIEMFSENNLICACMDVDRLANAIQEARSTEYGEYKSNTAVFLKKMEEELERLLEDSLERGQ